jgi:DNA-binding IclR family transcriptional regulator
MTVDLKIPSSPDLNDMPRETAGRGGVQSIERAFAIVEEIARNRDGITLAELSKRVGLHSSTTFHLVRTMVGLGYIRQVKDSKRYRVGRGLFALAASAFDENELVSFATPVLEELARRTGETAHLAARMNDRVVILARSAGPGALQVAERAGVVRPAHCTALGKVLLAALAQTELDQFLARAELIPHTGKSIIDRERLRLEIDDVRRRGIAYDDAEFDEEVRCVAAPVRGFSGDVIAAIGISGPIWRLSINALHDKGKATEEAAALLSAEFGHRPIAASNDGIQQHSVAALPLKPSDNRN